MIRDRALARLRDAATVPDLSGTRYELQTTLGRGGMGTVYLARDIELNRDVAIKVFHTDDASTAMADRMRQEARTLAQLEHPNIVPIYDFGLLPDGRLFYVMKRVDGHTLDAHEGSLGDRLRLFVKICDAVAFAHSKGVLHLDLKPANIMVGSFGEVLLMDWGLARTVRDEGSGLVAGTPDYMAPEQSRGDAVDHRADVFGLGRILRFLGGESIPRPLASIRDKAEAADPVSRYQSPQQLAAEVVSYLDGLGVSAHREMPWETVVRFVSRHRMVVLLILAYIAARMLMQLLFARRA